MRNRALVVLAALFVILTSPRALAQVPITRADAERAALAAGARLTLARADTAVVLARLRTARALPNPTLAASYSKSAPQKHLSLEIPLFDALRTRDTRVRQAQAEAHASRLLYASEKLAAVVEVDTTYTQVLATNARFRLSRQSARDADSLRIMTIRRRDAGDASELDVDLAAVSAGQQVNVATNDSLSYMSALLTLQVLMGMSPDSVAITLVDSLTFTARDTSASLLSLDDSNIAGRSATTPNVLAAEASLEAASLAVAVQKKSIFQLPALSIGVEFGDPSGDERGYLPTIGVAVPLPIFNRNQGPIAEAEAERERSRAQVMAARLEARRRVLEGMRERTQLIAKVDRDRELVVRAQRVANRSLTAYREGAAALPAVLEARRSAREVLSQYIDDLAALLIVNSELRALTQTVAVP